MDRAAFLNLLNNITSIKVNDALDMIREYCEDKGKPAENIAILLQVLSANPFILSQLINEVKSYYIQKLEITSVMKPVENGSFTIVKYI